MTRGHTRRYGHLSKTASHEKMACTSGKICDNMTLRIDVTNVKCGYSLRSIQESDLAEDGRGPKTTPKGLNEEEGERECEAKNGS